MLARRALVPGFGPILPTALVATMKASALAFQPAADDLLGAPGELDAAAERIDVGDVEKIDPARSRLRHDARETVLLGLQAEGHRAEREARDGKAGAAEADGGHGHG